MLKVVGGAPLPAIGPADLALAGMRIRVLPTWRLAELMSGSGVVLASGRRLAAPADDARDGTKHAESG